MANSASNSNLQSLDRLIGKWKLSGDAHGQIEYKWLEGGRFLMQDVDIEYRGRSIKGIELIGRLQRPGEEPSQDIWSRFYSFLDGLTLDYVYELAGDTLTIWFSHKHSDNFYQGTFANDGASFRGAWQWPGGGYSVVGVRIER
jgi:hypothetical protein